MSEIICNEYLKARADQINRNEARRIRTKVNDARKSSHDAAIRWPFELLQNALDAGPREGNNTVNLLLESTDNKVVFEHDGAPFSLQELAALLSGGSSKDFESDDKTGRFGTGFLVTHVLAEKTKLHGLVMGQDGYEIFNLILDRGGNEESILENIHKCEEALKAAQFTNEIDSEPSARFEYLVDDQATLSLGVDIFIKSLPFLYSTRPKLGQVTIVHNDGSKQTWIPSEPSVKSNDNGVIIDRLITVENSNGENQIYRSCRLQNDEHARSAAIIVLIKTDQQWKIFEPASEFPRLFREYPIRNTSFLPITFILDGKFEVTQERDKVLMTDEVKELIHEAINTIQTGIMYSLQEMWVDRHLLAKVALVNSLADNDEQTWWNEELKTIALALAKMPIIETGKGLGSAISNDEVTTVSFPLPRLLPSSQTDETTLERMWELIDHTDSMSPPVHDLVEDWCNIAAGWSALGVKVQLITVQLLGKLVRANTTKLDQLPVCINAMDWLARYIDIVGECWKKRNGIALEVLENILPNQKGVLVSPESLYRDIDLTDEIKDISTILGLDYRDDLLDTDLSSEKYSSHLNFLDETLVQAVKKEVSEQDIINELISELSSTLPDGEKATEKNQSLIEGSIKLHEYLSTSTITNIDLPAKKLPLLSSDLKIVRWTSDRLMMTPVTFWHPDAQPFSNIYPPNRVLSELYVSDSNDGSNILLKAFIDWGIAINDPLFKTKPAELKERRLAALADNSDSTEGMIVKGEEFSQIAMLPTVIFNRVKENKEAAKSLLGMILKYIAPNDKKWNTQREVIAKKDGDEITLNVCEALWLADTKYRAWVPFPGEDGETTSVTAKNSTLKDMLDPVWLEDNESAIQLLSEHFGFDSLELRLLGRYPDEEQRQTVRNGLAKIVDAAGSNIEIYDSIAESLRNREETAKNMSRLQKLGKAIEIAIHESLEKRGFHVEIIDRGFDFAVGLDAPEVFDDMSLWLEIDSQLIEIKATTTGRPGMTPLQAKTASREWERYSLCVVDLTSVPKDDLDKEWRASDVEPLTKIVSDIGLTVKETHDLVAKACAKSVGIRNEGKLRYEVPPEVWNEGVSINEWVANTISSDNTELT